MVQLVKIDGRGAWHKRYAEGSRRTLSLAALDWVARRFGLDPLRPPRHHTGQAALQTEERRLRELAGQQVHVPQVLAREPDALLLSDNGRSLAACLREADDAGCDRLVAAAVQAIAAAHRRGAYFGQPVPRNMTWDGQRIGFLDFEEDPLEVMPLEQAQARDWLMFGYGVARYYDHRPQVLQALLRKAMAGEGGGVQQQTHAVTGRLRRLAALAGRLGARGRPLLVAVMALHGATLSVLLVAGILLIDYLPDHDLDLLSLLTN